MTRKEYISNWHNDFVAYIAYIQKLVAGFMLSSLATERDKQGLVLCKLLLESKDVLEVEKSLSDGVVNREVLDKIEKLNKDLVDVAVEHLQTDVIVKEFWKQLAYFKIAQNRKSEEMRLSVLDVRIQD